MENTVRPKYTQNTQWKHLTREINMHERGGVYLNHNKKQEHPHRSMEQDMVVYIANARNTLYTTETQICVFAQISSVNDVPHKNELKGSSARPATASKGTGPFKNINVNSFLVLQQIHL